MSISFSGLASGLDTSSWVKSLTALKQAKVTMLQEERENFVLSKDTLSSIKSFFNSFRSTVEKITDTRLNIASMNLFAQNLATSANLKVLTATADTDAQEGVYDVIVNKLATNTKATSSIKYKTTRTSTTKATLESLLAQFGQAGTGDKLGVISGTISVEVDGIKRGLVLTGNETVQDLIDKFKAVGVNASYTNNRFSMDVDLSAIEDNGTGLKDALVKKFNLADVNKGYVTNNPLEITTTTNTQVAAGLGTKLTDLGIDLSGDNDKVTVKANDKTYEFTLEADDTIGSFLQALLDENIEASYDETTGVFTITNAVITDDGTTDLMNVFGFSDNATVISQQTQESYGLTYQSVVTTTTTATRDTKVNDLGTGYTVTTAEKFTCTDSNGKAHTITFTGTTTIGGILDQISSCGLNASIDSDGIIEITGGKVAEDSDTTPINIIDALGLTADPYSAMVTGNALTETIEVYELVTLSTQLCGDGKGNLGVRQGWMQVVNEDGETHHMYISMGMTIQDLMADLADIGIHADLEESTGILAITGGIFTPLSDADVATKIGNGQIALATGQLAQGTDLIQLLSGSPTGFTVEQTEVASTFARTRALGYYVTHTIMASNSTTLGNLSLAAAATTAKFDVRGTTVTVNLTTTMKIDEFIAEMKNKGIQVTFDTDTSRLEIQNATIIEESTITNDLDDILGLTTTISGKYAVSSNIYTTITETATGETTLGEIFKALGTTGSVTSGYTLAFNDGAIAVDENTTLNGLIDLLNDKGASATLDSTGRLSVIGGTLSGTVADALGIKSQTNTTAVSASGEILETKEVFKATLETKLSDLGVTGEINMTVHNSTGSVMETLTFAKDKTIQDVFDELADQNINASISDGVISLTSVEGKYVTGDLATNVFKIGAVTTTETVNTTQTSSGLVNYTDTVLAHLGSTLGEIGAVTNTTTVAQTLTVYRADGTNLGTISLTKDDTVQDLFDKLKPYDIIGTVEDGVISFYSAVGNYANGTIITNMNMTVQTGIAKTFTVAVTQSSSTVVQHDTTSIAVAGSKISDFITLATSATAGSTETATIQNTITLIPNDGTAVKTTVITSDTTFQNLFDWLDDSGIIGSINDGYITLDSQLGHGLTDAADGKGILDKLGIVTTQTQTVVTTTVGGTLTSGGLTVTGKRHATLDDTLNSAGLTLGAQVNVYNQLGEYVTSVTVAKTDTFKALFDKLSSVGITGTMEDGVISLTSAGGLYGTSTQLGITATTQTKLETAMLDTKLKDCNINTLKDGLSITIRDSGVWVPTYDEDGAITGGEDKQVGVVTLSANNTFGDMANALAAYGIECKLTNGTLTFDYTNHDTYALSDDLSLALSTVVAYTTRVTLGGVATSTIAVEHMTVSAALSTDHLTALRNGTAALGKNETSITIGSTLTIWTYNADRTTVSVAATFTVGTADGSKTIGDMLAAINASFTTHTIAGSATLTEDGYISIDFANAYVTGDLAEKLGIGLTSVTTSVTQAIAVTSSTQIKHTTVVTAGTDTKLVDLREGTAPGGGTSTGITATDQLVVYTYNQDRTTYLAATTITAGTLTVQQMLDAVEVYLGSDSTSFTNGIISIDSANGFVGDVITTIDGVATVVSGGIASDLGIGTVNVSVTSIYQAATMKSSSAITHLTVITASTSTTLDELKNSVSGGSVGITANVTMTIYTYNVDKTTTVAAEYTYSKTETIATVLADINSKLGANAAVMENGVITIDNTMGYVSGTLITALGLAPTTSITTTQTVGKSQYSSTTINCTETYNVTTSTALSSLKDASGTSLSFGSSDKLIVYKYNADRTNTIAAATITYGTTNTTNVADTIGELITYINNVLGEGAAQLNNGVLTVTDADGFVSGSIATILGMSTSSSTTSVWQANTLTSTTIVTHTTVAIASTGTKLTALREGTSVGGGTTTGITAGETLNIYTYNADRTQTILASTYTVGANDTIQTLLNTINGVLGSGAATFTDGYISIDGAKGFVDGAVANDLGIGKNSSTTSVWQASTLVSTVPMTFTGTIQALATGDYRPQYETTVAADATTKLMNLQGNTCTVGQTTTIYNYRGTVLATFTLESTSSIQDFCDTVNTYIEDADCYYDGTKIHMNNDNGYVSGGIADILFSTDTTTTYGRETTGVVEIVKTLTTTATATILPGVTHSLTIKATTTVTKTETSTVVATNSTTLKSVLNGNTTISTGNSAVMLISMVFKQNNSATPTTINASVTATASDTIETFVEKLNTAGNFLGITSGSASIDIQNLWTYEDGKIVCKLENLGNGGNIYNGGSFSITISDKNNTYNVATDLGLNGTHSFTASQYGSGYVFNGSFSSALLETKEVDTLSVAATTTVTTTVTAQTYELRTLTSSTTMGEVYDGGAGTGNPKIVLYDNINVVTVECERTDTIATLSQKLNATYGISLTLETDGSITKNSSGSWGFYLGGGLESKLGLNSMNNNIPGPITYSYAVDATSPRTVTVTATATYTTVAKLTDNIGVDGTIQIRKTGASGTHASITISADDTISSIIDQLDDYVSVSFTDGMLTVDAGSSGEYIHSIGARLASKLGLISSLSLKTTNTNSGKTLKTTPGEFADTTTQISKVLSYNGDSTSATFTFAISDTNGNSVGNITVSGSDTYGDVIDKFADYGIESGFNESGYFYFGPSHSGNYINWGSSSGATPAYFSPEGAKRSVFNIDPEAVSFTTTGTVTVTGSTTMGKLWSAAGNTGAYGGGSIYIKDRYDNVIMTITPTEAMTIDELIGSLNYGGMVASFDDGKIYIGAGTNDYHITTDRDHLLTMMKLSTSTRYGRQETTYVNDISDKQMQSGSYSIHGGTTLGEISGYSASDIIVRDRYNTATATISTTATTTIDGLLNSLNSAGMVASLDDGKIYIGAGTNDYHITVSNNAILTALKLSTSTRYGRQETSYVNDPSTTLKYTGTQTVTLEKTLADVGLSGSVIINIKNKNNGSENYVSVNSTTTYSALIAALRNKGIHADLVNGIFTWGGSINGNYVDSITGSIGTITHTSSDLKDTVVRTYMQNLSSSTLYTQSASHTLVSDGVKITQLNTALTSGTFYVVDKYGNTIHTFSTDANSTIKNFIDSLNNNDMVATFGDGIIEIGPNTNGYHLEANTNGKKILERLNITYANNGKYVYMTTWANDTSDTQMKVDNITIHGATTFGELKTTAFAQSTVVISDRHGVTQTTIVVKTGDTVQSFLNKLNTAGMVATLQDGKVHIATGTSDFHISNVTGDVFSVLGLSTTTKTQRAETTYANDISDKQYRYDSYAVDGTVTLGELFNAAGVANNLDNRLVEFNFYDRLTHEWNDYWNLSYKDSNNDGENDYDTTEKQLSVINNTTLAEFAEMLRYYGMKMTLTEDGFITIATDTRYTDSLGNLASIFKISGSDNPSTTDVNENDLLNIHTYDVYETVQGLENTQIKETVTYRAGDTSSVFNVTKDYTTDLKLSDISRVTSSVNAGTTTYTTTTIGETVIKGYYNGQAYDMTFAASQTIDDVLTALASKGIQAKFDITNKKIDLTGNTGAFIIAGGKGLFSSVAMSTAKPTVTTIVSTTDISDLQYKTVLTNMTTDSKLSELRYTVTSGTTTTVKTLTADDLVMTVVQNGTATELKFNLSNSLGDVLTVLAGYGISGSITDGKLKLTSNALDSYITYMDDEFQKALNLETDDSKYKTQITVATHGNKDSTVLSSSHTDLVLNGSSIIKSIAGYDNDTDDNAATIAGTLLVREENDDTKTITVNQEGTLDEFFQLIANYGFTGTVDNNGEVTIMSNGDRYLEAATGGSNILTALKIGTTKTSDTITLTNNTTSDSMTHTKTVEATGTTTLGNLQYEKDVYTTNAAGQTTATTTTISTIAFDATNKATMKLETYSDAGNTTVTLTFTSANTIHDVIDKLAKYGIQAFIDSAGRFSVQTSTLKDFKMTGTLATYLMGSYTKLYDADTTYNVSDILKDDKVVYMTDDTKLSELTDQDGNNLEITTGNIYAYEDGTRYLVEIKNSDTIQTLRSKLSQYGITVGISTDGKLYFDGDNNSYLTTDGITSGASNILTKLGATTWNERHDSTSKNLCYTVVTNDRVDGDTKITALNETTDDEGNNADDVNIQAGVYYVVQNGVKTTETITADTTVDDLIATLGTYGMIANVNSDGKIEVGANHETYLLSAAGGTNMVDVLFEEWNFTNIYSSNNLEIPEDVVVSMSEDTKLADINVTKHANGTALGTSLPAGTQGYTIAGCVAVVKDGVKTYITIGAEDTVGTFKEELEMHGFDVVINDDGRMIVRGDGNSTLENVAAGSGYTKSDILDLLGITVDKWVMTNTYASDTVVVTKTANTDFAATRDTKLSELGVTTGEYFIYNNGVKNVAFISSDETVGSVIDTLASFGIQASLIQLSDSESKLKITGNGDSYVETSTTEVAANRSNVVDILFANKSTKYTYEDTLTTTHTETTYSYVDGSTLISEYCANRGKTSCVGNLALSVNGVKNTIEITADETFDSLINKFNALGLRATLVDGTLMIEDIYEELTIYNRGTNGTTSYIMNSLGLAYDSSLGGYCASIADCTVIYDEDVVESAAEWASTGTDLRMLNITKGTVSVYRNGEKALINIDDSITTFEDLNDAIQDKFSDVTLSFENGYLKIDSANAGVNVELGTNSDTSNFSQVCGLVKETDSNGDAIVKSARELYCVNGSTKLMTEGIFKNGNVNAGTFYIGDAELIVDENTTVNDLISQIVANDAAQATAYWDTVDGKLVIKSRKTGASFINIEAGTSNLTDILGLTTTDNELNNSYDNTKDSASLNSKMSDFGITAGSIQFSLLGTTYKNITIDSNDTFIDLENKLNEAFGTNDSNKIEVTITDGKLEIASKNSSQIRATGGSSNFRTVLNMTNSGNNIISSKFLQTASQRLLAEAQETGENASFSINGTHYTSTSNEVDSSVTRIQGLKINLKGVSENGEATTLVVEKDNESIANAVSDIVDAYNELMTNVNKELAMDGALHDQSALKYIRNQLRSLMTSSVPGAMVFKNLDAIGIGLEKASASNISTANINTLEFNKTKFLDAMKADREAVQSLLVGTDSSKGVFWKMEDIVEQAATTTAGYFASADRAYNKKISRLDEKIRKQQQAVEAYQARLEAKFSAMDLLISKIQTQYSSFLGS